MSRGKKLQKWFKRRMCSWTIYNLWSLIFPWTLGVPIISFFFFYVTHTLILFIYLWLCWVFVSVRGLSLVEASGGHSSSRCVGLSLSRPLLLRSTGSRRAGSVVVAHWPSCSAVCGTFPDQGSNPCPLHWQADSQPLRHQGSPLQLSLDAKLSQKLVPENNNHFIMSRDFHGKVHLGHFMLYVALAVVTWWYSFSWVDLEGPRGHHSHVSTLSRTRRLGSPGCLPFFTQTQGLSMKCVQQRGQIS